MTEFFHSPTPTRAHAHGPGPAGRAVLLILWLVMGVVPLVTSYGDLQLATGSAGIPGTLTVDECLRLGKGRYDCHGTFAPDGAGPAVAVDATPDSEAGDVVRAQLDTGTGRAVPTGTAGVLAALAVPFIGVAVLALLPAVAMWATGRLRHVRTALVVGVPLAVLAGTGCLVGLIAAA